MPSKKGRHMASRQAGLAHRGKHKGAAHPQLSAAQLQGPGSADSSIPGVQQAPVIDDSTAEQLVAPAITEPDSDEAEGQTVVPTMTAAGPKATRAMSPRARRERQAIAAQSGPKLQSELLRIGTVMFIIVAVLVSLTYGTDLGA
jgi:hypothetical protein